MRFVLALLLASTLAAEGPGGFGVSILTEEGCSLYTGPGQSAIALGRGWNNGWLDNPVTVYYTNHEATAESQVYTEEVMAVLRRMLPLVTLVKTTDVNAKMTIRVQSVVLPNSNMLGIAEFPYSIEPGAGDVKVQTSMTGTKLWRVLAHEIGHAMGLPHTSWFRNMNWGGTLLLPYYTDGPRAYGVYDQVLFGSYYRVSAVRR